MPTPVDAPHDRRSGELAARNQTKPNGHDSKQTNKRGGQNRRRTLRANTHKARPGVRQFRVRKGRTASHALWAPRIRASARRLTVRRARHGGRRTMAAWRRGSNGARHDSQRLPAAARVGCKHAETCVLLSRRRFGADIPRRPLCLPAGPRTAQARYPTCTCRMSHLLPVGPRTAPLAFARLPPARACRGRSGTRGRERCSTVSAVPAGGGRPS
jgi:hypothetical protein